MAGSCPKNYKNLKGGVSCVDAAGHSCFCSKYGCKCGTYFEGSQQFKDFDAHVDWCTQYDPHGKYNQFCKDHSQNIDDPHGAGGQAAGQAGKAIQDAAGITGDTLTYLALGGIALLVLIVAIR